MTPRILTIAGSDSGGGAGIQADIKTITMLGGHAMTAITAITAQNTVGVDAVELLPPELVIAQAEAVARDIGVDAIKIGMLGSAGTAAAVADWLAGRGPGVPVVLDPVMIASSGAVLADAATIAALDRLMRLATLVTPNAPELALLTGHAIETVDDLAHAAEALATRTGRAVLAKGGHLAGDTSTDVLVGPTGARRWTSGRIETRHTHGTGCTLSAAIATGLAHDPDLERAIEVARAYVLAAMRAAPGFGAGHGPMGHALGRSYFP